MSDDFALWEALRYEPRAGWPNGYARLGAHLDRAAAGAAFFGWPDPRDAALGALRAQAEALAAEPDRWRVRLTIRPDGAAEAARALLTAGVARARTAALARTPVDAGDVFLRHKTTRRAAYDARRAERAYADDVLLWNGAGELTEFTAGNLVVERGGARWTPPAECGLLAGVFRAELLARGLVRERVLRAEDLVGARVWQVSSLREWVPVELLAAA